MLIKILSRYEKILTLISKIFEIVGMVALVLLMLILGSQAILGWLSISLLWSDEMCFYMNYWVVFMGAAVLMYENKHVKVDLIVDKMPKYLRTVFEIIIHLICLGVSVFLIISSIKYMSALVNVKTTVLKLPKFVYYIIPTLSFSYMILTFIYHIGAIIKNLSAGKEDKNETDSTAALPDTKMPGETEESV